VLSCLCRYTYLGECPAWPSWTRPETGKIDYIVRVADHKRAESAPGVIALEPHIHQLLGKYVIIVEGSVTMSHKTDVHPCW
jgi:hypothetical protein